MRKGNNLVLTLCGEIRQHTDAEIILRSGEKEITIPENVIDVGKMAEIIDPIVHTNTESIEFIRYVDIEIGGIKFVYSPSLVCNADDGDVTEEYDAGFNQKVLGVTVQNGVIEATRPFYNFIYDSDNTVIYGPKFDRYVGPVCSVNISRNGARSFSKKLSLDSGVVARQSGYHYFVGKNDSGKNVYFKAILAEKLRDPTNAGGLRVSTKTYAGAIVAAYVHATHTECDASKFWRSSTEIVCTVDSNKLLHNAELERFFDKRSEYVEKNVYNLPLHALAIKDNVLSLKFNNDQPLQIYTDEVVSKEKIGNCAILAGVMCAQLNSPHAIKIDEPLARDFYLLYNFYLTAGAVTYEGGLAIGSTEIMDNPNKVTIFQDDFNPATFSICAFRRSKDKKQYMHAKLKDSYTHYGVISIIDDKHCSIVYDSLGIFDPSVVLNTADVAESLTEYHLDCGYWDGTKASLSTGIFRASSLSLAALNILDSVKLGRV